MLTPNKRPRTAGTVAALQKHTRRNHTRPLRKWQRVLKALLAGRTFNRFQAERDLGDHCLPSTVAGLQARRVSILRDLESVPGFAGYPTRAMRYRLDRTPENITRAVVLLEGRTGPKRDGRTAGIGQHSRARVAVLAGG
jgi:hypothetical protein